MRVVRLMLERRMARGGEEDVGACRIVLLLVPSSFFRFVTC